MSIHISAKPGEIAPVVLMPGDPLRARFIAEKYLSNARLVSQTRNILYYTGTYQGKEVTIGASGMGCPSIGIYSYELYSEYQVETIIRIGTCGAYTTDLKLYDLINAESAASESTFAQYAWGFTEDLQHQQGNIFDRLTQNAARKNQSMLSAAIHSSDIFYRKDQAIPAIAAKYNCKVVEMESFALFANARQLNKNAACLLTVTDIIPTHEKLSSEEREKALKPMMELALDTVSSL